VSTRLVASPDDLVDHHVDEEIAACLSLEAPRSFFLFAGAGSGKTGSLVKALEFIRARLKKQLRARGQRVAVITYTNAASDEIQRRIQFDPLIDVSTIHSFAWTLIEGLTHDIKVWLTEKLAADLQDLREKQARGRPASAAYQERKASIESKTRRLQNLPNVRKFTYSPTGENRGRDALNHAEVLQITASLLRNKPTMQSILTGRYPILLIDESQDTMRDLVDAFFVVEENQQARFQLGLLGDMMQRIYFDGKDRLGEGLPSRWEKPVKRMNHRCPKRIVKLINKIREPVDQQQQQPRSDAQEGFVRLFILPASTVDKPGEERAIAASMKTLAGDDGWSDQAAIKTLTLEHRMAARRMGFDEAFAPLYAVKGWSTGLLDGKLSIVQFFAEQVMPLVEAKSAGDRFAVARLTKKFSPLMSREALIAAPDQQQQLRNVDAAVSSLANLWKDGADPALQQVLAEIVRSDLLDPPELLRAAAAGAEADPDEADDADPPSAREAAVREFLKAPSSQMTLMSAYLSGRERFGTHQGVKGLEFERVMVIMDDSEAGGFLFKYDELFGVGPSEKRLAATRRLFYVTTSRARSSLALVAYAQQPEVVAKFVREAGWFDDAEIRIGSLRH
jgi:DNA helicase-2/ATP-dependent DNA helicase PcrA